ncbi:S9 family peptidase [Desulfobacula phenolica]|uniref:Acyl-peptide hydrolase n=1 Tax=Desulfobacula phenolica TaxID=90732 RepID=A0A1H2FLU7_9BACT|nr:alpha/beta fold hydrolase [Desulfobacula phenolica]SDU08289.1 Dipeptidyl aminopeptidase/acylaminoacyl peptidase [Desulfobacula phenolica]
MKPLSRCFILICFLTVFVVFCGFAHAFTVKDILSAPYPENLTAGSNLLAWTLNDEGARNIWVASGPDFTPVQVTPYTGDNGIKLSNLLVTPDDAYILYSRGSGSMQLETTDIVSGPSGSIGVYRQGAATPSNPANSPVQTERAIWAVSVKGGLPWKLAKGNNPMVSRDGKTVTFNSQGQFFEIAFDPSVRDTMPEPRPMFTIQGTNQNGVWSPDGETLMFVSDRDSHSLIGLFHRKTRQIQWIMPGVDRDMSPVWSTDGRRVAFARVPGKTKHELFDLTAEFTFSICVADVATGKGDIIWQTPETGGWAQWYPPYADWFGSALRWTQNNRLLFYSEHQGRLHIYSTTPSGEDLKDLTPGESQVWGSTLTLDGTMLYYSSNRNTPDYRHIWQTPTSGGDTVQVTRGESVETNPVIPGKGGFIAYRRATGVTPQAVTVQKINADKFRTISPNPLPQKFPDTLVKPREMIFPSDDFQIHCQLFMPEYAAPGDPLPAIIFVHGGPFRQMLLGWSHRPSYSKTYAMNQYLANKGYIVLCVNFRSGTGYGRAFRQAENQGPRGASEYRDIQAALARLSRLPNVDPKRIGIWGESCGGYLTALSLARNSDLFAAGVALAGIYDFSFRATNMSVPGGEWGLQGAEGLEIAFQSSPVADVENWKSPVLLVHGDDDRSVLFAQTVNLVQDLRKQGVPVEFMVLPGEDHDFVLHENWVRTLEAAGAFFDRVLKN